MLLDLSRFRSGVEHLERRYDPSAFSGREDDFRVVEPASLVVDVKKDGDRVRLVGRVTAALECDCGRCLEPFAVRVDAPFDLMFLPVSANAGAGDREITDGDVGVSVYEKDIIDLGDVMREQFYLALPMKPLCRKDCQGLCPVCGVNKNRETCTCQAEWVDPRMEQLRKLRNRDA
jgi:uncharacterized protein